MIENPTEEQFWAAAKASGMLEKTCAGCGQAWLTRNESAVHCPNCDPNRVPPPPRDHTCCQCNAVNEVESRHNRGFEPCWVKITWVCANCQRFVCCNCALTVEGSVPLVYADVTLCSMDCARALQANVTTHPDSCVCRTCAPCAHHPDAADCGCFCRFMGCSERTCP